MNDALIFLNHSQLTRHPRNMRRAYPVGDVRRMAVSQMERAKRGEPACVQPLIVTVGPGVIYDPAEHCEFVIVAGHMRHAGNASLKGSAPPLNCIVRYYASKAEMLADMGTENGPRTDPGLIAWAEYLRDQIAAGVKLHQVMQRTGLTIGRVRLLEALLELTPPARQLVNDGALPLGAVEHLKRVTDTSAQSELARELAGRRATLAQTDLAVKAWLARSSGAPGRAARSSNCTDSSAPETPALAGAPKALPARLRHVRAAAREACHECGSDARLDEPAWEIAVAAVKQTCGTCDLKGFEVVCKSCPLAQAMREVVALVKSTPTPTPTTSAAEVIA
jgi:hypothetical protein